GGSKEKFDCAYCEAGIGDERLILAKPQSFMNLSGEAVQNLARFYKIDPASITVFHDELDLPLGKIRFKTGGGNGGHNGLRSLDANIGEGYNRIRIGISHPGIKEAVKGYVLQDFRQEEWPLVENLIGDIVAHAPLLAKGDSAGFMNKITLNAQAREPIEEKE
ncbi:MAG: aminoacyl-tRNA hydrolase, partial [Dongiaceae bacterium]